MLVLWMRRVGTEFYSHVLLLESTLLNPGVVIRAILKRCGSSGSRDPVLALQVERISCLGGCVGRPQTW